jgi:hypothetical protein
VRATFVFLAIASIVLSSAITKAEDRTPVLVKRERTGEVVVGGEGSFIIVLTEVLALAQRPASDDDAVIAQLSKDRNQLAAPYLYELARRTFPRDKPRALYWFNLAELRMQYDARRCQDESARDALGIAQSTLAPLVGAVVDFARDKSKVAASLRSLRSRDEVFDGQASPWWICSHTDQALQAGAKGATLKSDEWLKPENEWWAIQQSVKALLDENIARFLGR